FSLCYEAKKSRHAPASFLTGTTTLPVRARTATRSMECVVVQLKEFIVAELPRETALLQPVFDAVSHVQVKTTTAWRGFVLFVFGVFFEELDIVIHQRIIRFIIIVPFSVMIGHCRPSCVSHSTSII